MPEYILNWHQEELISVLQEFAEGKIKKLMVFMPPQHGKSQLTSRHLPAFILGINPNLKIAGCSYSADLARSFNRDVQRLMDSKAYIELFPETMLSGSNTRNSAKGAFLRNSDMFEVVGKRGSYKSVGVGGSLTGSAVDIGIIDDPVKDVVEANSPTYRARVWDWYNGVFLTRQPNSGQQLIIQTRWHEDDLSGRILKSKTAGDWVIVNFPAILRTPARGNDPRRIGEALWPERHSLKKLLEFEGNSPRLFQAMYQQDPKPFSGGLVYPRYSSCTVEEFAGVRAEAVGGIDFGYNSPFAFVSVKIDKYNKRIYIRSLVYKRKLGPEAILKAVTSRQTSKYMKIVADSADPTMIHYLKDVGLNISPVKKIKDSILSGIKILNDHEIVVCEGSEDLEQELRSYRYKEDLDGTPLEEPIKENDHALDAVRYVILDQLAGKNNSAGLIM